jgi:large subunit ribosomal protein L30
MGKKFIVTQIKSDIGCSKTQIATLRALGLRGRSKSATLVDGPAFRGQVLKVQHLVKIEGVKS